MGDDKMPMHVFQIQHQRVSGEKGRFSVRTDNPHLIEKAKRELDKQPENRNLRLNGQISVGDGGFNSPWHWHVEDNNWDLVELSMEVCDGTPEMVEADVKYWVEVVGRYCPFSSFVLSEETLPG